MDTINMTQELLNSQNAICIIGIITFVSRFYHYCFRGLVYDGFPNEILETVIHLIAVGVIYIISCNILDFII